MSSIDAYLIAGRECLQRGDYAGALDQADAALVVEEQSFDALQLRCRALHLLGRDTEALAALREAHVALHQAPIGQPPAELPYPTHEAPADTEPVNQEALETLIELHARYHLDVDLLTLLGDLAEDALRYDVARDAFEELIGMEPNRLDAWEGLVHVLCHTNLDAALDAVERALEIFPSHALFHEFLGFIHFRRRRYHLALDAYREAIARGADHPDNYEAVIECFLALNELDQAMDELARYTHREANDPETHRFAVEAALDSGQHELALQHAHQLVRLEPSRPETYCYKAWVELALNDWEAAARTLRLGFHKAVDGEFALYELVDILVTDGIHDEALRVADLACALAPDAPDAYAARGKVLKEMGALDEAMEAFRHAASLAPHDDLYQTWIGAVLTAQGDHHGAIRQFNAVLAHRPDDVWTLVHRGLTFLSMDVPERAYADFARGLEIDPEEAHLHFWRACALVKLGDFDAALVDLQTALDQSDELFEGLETEPMLDPLRDDPRFIELLRPPDEE